MPLPVKILTRKVISYCDIPEKVAKTVTAFEVASPDSYIEYRITPGAEQLKFDDDFTFDNWAIKENPTLEGQTLFVHIDY